MKLDEAQEILVKKIFINKRVHRLPKPEKAQKNNENNSSVNSVFIGLVVLVMAIMTLQYLSGIPSSLYVYSFVLTK